MHKNRHLLGFAVVFLLASCAPQASHPPSPQKIVIAGSNFFTMALVDIAQTQGFAAQEGVDIEMRRFEAGKFALQELLQGKVDLAAAADTAFVFQSFDHPDLRIIAVINESNTVKLIVRKDRGIAAPADLAGKRIGLTKGTSAEFFLEQYASFHNLALGDVELVDLKPQDVPGAMQRGEIDAALSWDPFVFQMQKSLGDNVTTWDPQGTDQQYFLLITKQDWTLQHPDLSQRLLRALFKAEEFIEQNPEQSRDIITARIGQDPQNARSTWGNYFFFLRLPQELLPLLEAQARWAVRSRPSQADIPNFLRFIDIAPMDAVRPEAVSIIH